MGFLDFLSKKEITPPVRYIDLQTGKEFSNDEITKIKRESIWDIVKGSVSGLAFGSKFVSDVYRDVMLETHEEKVRSKKAYDYDAYIATAVDTYCSFVIGGDTFFKTDNESLDKTVNALYNDLGLKEFVETNLVIDLKVDGDSYLERRKGSSGFIEQYDYVPDPEYMYADFEENGEVKQYVQRIPDGQVQSGDDELITILYYGKLNKKAIRGTKIPRDKIFHLKMGRGIIPFYGRGSVATIINDFSIGLEIDRSFAVMARYYALKKKLMQISGAQDKDLVNIKTQIGASKDYENAMTGWDGAINPIELVGTGAPADLAPIVDYNKRKKTVGLAPEFIIHGEDTNRATSREQIEGFYLRAQQTRTIIARFIEEEMKRVLEERRIPYNPESLKLMFQNIFSENQEAKVRLLLDAWRNNAIMLKDIQNEMSKYFDITKDEELGDRYFSDVGGTDPISDVLKKQLGNNERSKDKGKTN